MTLKEMGIGMLVMDVENDLFSKVRGNRNWAIRVEHTKKVAFVGKFGMMNRRNFMTAMVQTIIEKKIRWYTYTYKKDFMACVDALEKAGYTIWWMN